MQNIKLFILGIFLVLLLSINVATQCQRPPIQGIGFPPGSVDVYIDPAIAGVRRSAVVKLLQLGRPQTPQTAQV